MINYFQQQQNQVPLIYPPGETQGRKSVPPTRQIPRPTTSLPNQEKILTSPRTTYLIETDTELGHGTFGAVKLVRDTIHNKNYAVKIISKEKMKKLNAERNIRSELSLHSSLNHRNIIKFIETFEDKNNIYIVLEHCAKGNLFKLLQRKEKLTEPEAFRIFYSLARALEYLAVQNIVHRDVKPANILFFEDNTVKLCDYNWACKLQTGEQCNPVICGTTEYMPPEVVYKQKHDQRVDIWSLGVVLYEMLHGELPFKGSNQKEKIQKIVCATGYKLNPDLSLDLQQLLHLLLSRIVKYRPTYAQIFQSEWVQRMMKELQMSDAPRRAATQYRKVHQPQSDRLSCFSSSSQNTMSTAMKSRYTSQDTILPTEPKEISPPLPQTIKELKQPKLIQESLFKTKILRETSQAFRVTPNEKVRESTSQYKRDIEKSPQKRQTVYEKPLYIKSTSGVNENKAFVPQDEITIIKKHFGSDQIKTLFGIQTLKNA